MRLLDSRASRMSPNKALLTLHADCICGQNANYYEWYFAMHFNFEDIFGHTRSTKSSWEGSSVNSPNDATELWRQAMSNTSHYDRMVQIALYLLCWEEAAQVRFVPGYLCFIFMCAYDRCRGRYWYTPDPEGLYLRVAIEPFCRFICNQGYEVVDGRFVRGGKDHTDIIGYDQLFWHSEGIVRIVLNDNVGPPP